MAQPFSRCENIVLGQAVADKFQGPTHMALLLSKSLQKCGKFDGTHVMSHYLYSYYNREFDMGGMLKSIYEEFRKGITNPSLKLTKQHFKFPIEVIYNASYSVHSTTNGFSGGCNPAQRSFPLACCLKIDDKDLFQIACDEARLTHYSDTARHVSGLTNLICRRLIKGDEWNDAIQTAFSAAPNLLGEIREIKSRYKHDNILNFREHPAYAPNTLHTALYCVTNTDSFESALKRARELDEIYCPTLVGIFAGARWVVPPSMLDNCPRDKLFNEIHQTIRVFNNEWNVTLNGRTSLLKKFK